MSTDRHLLVSPQITPLQGSVAIPGDKSISHRVVMLGALADGPSHLHNWLPAGDTLATLQLLRDLGVEITVQAHTPTAWELQVAGRGLHGLRPPTEVLQCHNAGTCMRLMVGVLAGQRFSTILDGSPQLRRRPMRRVTDPLSAMGAQITTANGYAPLSIQPGRLYGREHHLNVASAQVKSALLLAGLYADGATTVAEAGPTRDHTERLLLAMGVNLATAARRVTLQPPTGLTPVSMTVPGDFSSAAFLMVAGMLAPHSRLQLTHVGCNPTRTGLGDVLQRMGGDLTYTNPRPAGGEAVADLVVASSGLTAVEVEGEEVVRAIDEFPIWAVAATQAEGSSVLRQAAELRVKEVDRISVLSGELRRLGAVIEERPDGMIVTGPTRLKGGVVHSHGDHRLGMALVVAGLLAAGPTLVQEADCISDSFPGFVASLQALGARLTWVA